MPYGIDQALWNKLPADDQAAIKAGYLGTPANTQSTPSSVTAATPPPPATTATPNATQPLVYGIAASLWTKLPSDDQAAVKALAEGKTPPAIGGYAPAVNPTQPSPAPLGVPTLPTTPMNHTQPSDTGGMRTPQMHGPGDSPPASQSKGLVITSGPAQGVRMTANDLALVNRLKHATIPGGFRIQNPLLTVEAAKDAGLPLTLALALLTQESSGGINEWGADRGKNFNQGVDATTGKNWGLIMTQAAYDAYRAQRTPANEQGVGPTQLTTTAQQNDADALGGAWKPLPNMVVGFSYLAGLIRSHDGKVSEGLYHYNGNPSYPGIILGYERQWAAALGLQSIGG